MTKEKIKVGIMGFGVVGTGTYKVLTENSEMIKSQTGAEIVVEKVFVRDRHRKRAVEIPESLLSIPVFLLK